MPLNCFHFVSNRTNLIFNNNSINIHRLVRGQIIVKYGVKFMLNISSIVTKSTLVAFPFPLVKTIRIHEIGNILY